MIMFSDDKKSRVIFHFNKAHLQDPTIPMWVLKHKGKTHYVHHVEFNEGIGFSTKETPENSHTKGSIMIKGRLEIYKEDEMTYGKVY